MKIGDLVRFEGGVAVWDAPNSPANVVGRTQDGVVYLILGEGRITVLKELEDQALGLEEIWVLGSDGVMGWVSSRTVKREL